MPSLNELLHEIVEGIHGKSNQKADALHAKVDDVVPPEVAPEDEKEAE